MIDEIKLKDILIKLEKSSIKAGEGKSTGNYPLYTCSSMLNKYYDDYLYDEEAIIVGTGGSPAINYCNGKFCASTDCWTFISNDKYEVKYIYYLLLSKINELQKMFRGAGLKHLNREEFMNIQVKTLDTEDQKNIINKLDRIQEIIGIRKKQIEELDVLVKARFVELLESTELSDETTIEAVTEQVKVGFVGTCEKYYTDESGVPMLRTGNITDKGIDLKDLKYVTKEFHEKNKKSQIHTGDLLIARHGSNGQANVYSGPEAQCLNAVVIVPNQSVVSSIFLAGLINSPAVKEQIERTLVGSTQRVVNTKSIANLKVRVPSTIVQKRYEEFVKQTDKSKLELQKSLEEMQNLFDSLMAEYFG